MRRIKLNLNKPISKIFLFSIILCTVVLITSLFKMQAKAVANLAQGPDSKNPCTYYTNIQKTAEVPFENAVKGDHIVMFTADGKKYKFVKDYLIDNSRAVVDVNFINDNQPENYYVAIMSENEKTNTFISGIDYDNKNDNFKDLKLKSRLKEITVKYDNKLPQISNVSSLKVKGETGTDNSTLVKDGDKVKVSFNIGDDCSGINSNSIKVSMSGVDATVANGLLSYDNNSGQASAIFTVGKGNNEVNTTEGQSFAYRISCADNAKNVYTDKEDRNTDQKIDSKSPVISSVSTTSNNTNNKLIAKIGDKINISFTSDKDIIVKSAQIGGSSLPLNLIQSADNRTFVLSYTVNGTEVNDNSAINFNIKAEDYAGNLCTIDKNTNDKDVIYHAPIKVENLTYKANNDKDSSFAKNGDKVTLTFNTNHAVQIANDGKIKIAGQDAIVKNVNGTDWTAEYTVQKDITKDNNSLDFSKFTLSDADGNNPIDVAQDKTKENVTYYAPITINGVVFQTSNGNKQVAKDGDEVELSFTTAHPVNFDANKGIVKIAGQETKIISDNNDGMHWKAKCKVKDGQIQDNSIIDFSDFTANDAAGNEAVTTKYDSVKGKIIYNAPIKIKDVVFKSNNINNNGFAKNGDTISLNFITGHPVKIKYNEKQDSKKVLTSKNFEIKSKDGMHWEASYKVTGSEIGDNNQFTFSDFTVEDAAGNKSVQATQKNLMCSKITYLAPIVINNLSFKSSNKNEHVAKNGDTIVLSFKTGHPVNFDANKNTIKVAGQDVQLTSKNNDGMHWQAQYTMQDGVIKDNSVIDFSDFTANDAAQNKAVTTKDKNTNEKIVYYAPIKINNVVFKSSNNNNSLVKNGDTILLSFETGHPVKIKYSENGNGLSSKNFELKSQDKMNWQASYTVIGKEISDNSQFTFSDFTVEDEAGNTPVQATEKNLTSNTITYYAPIVINNVTFQSSNKNSVLAKNGDNITLSFTTSHPINFDINKNIVNISGNDIQLTSDNNDGMHWKAQYTVQDGAIKDNTGFTFTDLTAADAAGNMNVTLKQSGDNEKVTYYAPITINQLSFASNNESKNPNIAKDGDVITLSFSTTHPINITSMVIQGQNVQPTTKDNMNWQATYTIQNGNIKDNTSMQFSFTVGDDAQNPSVSKTDADVAKIIYYAPIVVNNLKFTSNNVSKNELIAKNGDEITLSFDVTHPVNLTNVKIAGKDPASIESTSNDNMHWIAKYNVANGDTVDQANIALTFTVNDAACNPAVTKTDADVSKIKYYAPIIVTNTKIATSNSKDSNKYAKDGDTVTVTFNTQHITECLNAQISGKGVQCTSNDGKSWTATYKINNGDNKDLSTIPFEFTVSDAAKNAPVTKKFEDSDVTNRIQYFAPITSNQSITSDGANKAYAKKGSRITVLITANHNVSVASSSILDKASTQKDGENGTRLSVSYVISNDENSIQDGIAKFNIGITDLAGNLLSINDTNDNPKSTVTYDQTLPKMEIQPLFSGFVNKDITYSAAFSDTNLDPNGASLEQNGSQLITADDKAAVLSGSKDIKKQVLLSNEDEYKINATVTDLAGNKCDKDGAVTIIIDKTNPRIISTKFKNSTTKTFRKGFKIADYFKIEEKYLNDIVCKVTNENGTQRWNVNNPLTTDGKNTIYLVATDKAGNASKALTYDLYIDGTAPKPVVNDITSGRSLQEGTDSTPFVTSMQLRLSLQSMNMGDEKPDHFTSILLKDKDGNLVKDILHGKNDKDAANNIYKINLTDYKGYSLTIDAVDDVGNSIHKQYNFTLHKKSMFETYYENKPLLYVSVSSAMLALGTISVLVFIKIRKIRK